MGNYLSVNLESIYKKNQEFIQDLETTQMERQIQLMYQWQERQKAIEIARTREFTNWFLVFYGTASVSLFTGFRRTKRSYLLMPLLPLTFVCCYYVDMAYGNKIHRIRMEAEHILTHEADMLEIPCGLPTPSTVDQGRISVEEKNKLHPPQL